MNNEVTEHKISDEVLKMALIAIKPQIELAKHFWTNSGCAFHLASDTRPSNQLYFLSIINTWEIQDEQAPPFWYINETLKRCKPIGAFYVNWDAVYGYLQECEYIYASYTKSEKISFKKKYPHLHQEIESSIEKRAPKKSPEQTMGKQSALSIIGQLGAAKTNSYHDGARKRAIELATNYLKSNTHLTQGDVADKILLVFEDEETFHRGAPYAKTTIIKWIKKLVPKKPGRPTNTNIH